MISGHLASIGAFPILDFDTDPVKLITRTGRRTLRERNEVFDAI